MYNNKTADKVNNTENGDLYNGRNNCKNKERQRLR